MHGALLVKSAVALLMTTALIPGALAATALKINFTLNTTNKNGAPITQSRYYYRYRPDGFSTGSPLPAILVMEEIAGGGANWVLNAKADQVGIVIVTGAIPGNSLGGSWNNRDPRWVGSEDYDYTSEVIDRVRVSDSCNDFFICGLSKGGSMAYNFACHRPAQIKAASSLGEFIVLVASTPSAPVPVIAFQGTLDSPYAMARDSVDIWRTIDGVLNTAPVVTFESSPLIPGKATQATWFGGPKGTQVAWVTLVGGTHSYPTPSTDTGYNYADGLWAFFSQFLTSQSTGVRIVSQPVNNTQYAGQPASFWVAATGDAPMSFQWQKNGTNILDATSRWYTTAPTTLADNGATYRCVVANAASMATSGNATLRVLSLPAGPSITPQPTDVTVIAGQPFSFHASASGSRSLSYQWQQDGTDVEGATSSTLSGKAAVTTDSGSVFRLLVRDSTGTTTSRCAVLTVLPAPGAPIILENPRRVSVLLNQSGPFSVRAWSATPMSYQWQKSSAANGANPADIPGATNSSYRPPPSSTPVNQPYRCIVSNSAGSSASACELYISDATASKAVFFAGLREVSGQVGMPFSYQIWVRGATLPVTYLASPLPPGLTVDASTGVISGVPTTAGTNQISISASNSAGALTSTITLNITAYPPPIPIDTWRTVNFGASAIDAAIAANACDPDEDGWPNIVEYALATGPLAPTEPAFGLSLENGFLTQTAIRNATAGGIAWSAESSTDLLHWSGTNTIILVDTPTTFKARDNVPATADLRRFLRLRISLLP